MTQLVDIDGHRRKVERDLGPVTNIPQRSEDLLQQARDTAGPLYEQAYAAPGADMMDLSGLAGRPTFDKALREAYSEVLDEGGDPSAMGLELVGEDVLLGAPSWQALDYAKRGLDNIIERGIRQGDMPEVRRAQMMKQELVSQMDTLNPAYGQARQAYAGPAQERGFLEQGRSAFREDSEQFDLDMSKLTPEQAEQVRLGIQSGTLRDARRVRNNSNPWGQMNNREREGIYNAAYGDVADADVARLLEQRDLELRLAGNANRLIGSSETGRAAVADEYFKQAVAPAGEASNAIMETALMGGPWITAAKGFGDRFLKDRRERFAAEANRALADEIGPLLLRQGAEAGTDLQRMTQDDAAYQAIVEELLKSGEGYGRRIGTAAGVAGANAYSY